MSMTAEQIIRRLDKIKAERSNYESTWQDVSKYVLPRKAYITRTQTPGAKYDYDVFDSTAMMSNVVLAAGLHSYLTNPSSKWFTLRLQNAQLEEDKAIKEWLKKAEDRIYDVLNASNFAQQIHELYTDLGVFGFGCLYLEEDPTDRVRFYCRNVQEIFIEEDEKERVTTVYRKFQFTVRQVYETWKNVEGASMPAIVEKKMEAKEYSDKIDLVHYVGPRYDRDVQKVDNKNMAYESQYIELSGKHTIEEGGYLEFPFFCPRFNKNSSEVYGSSPAMVSYSDIKMLNRMSLVTIRAAEKIVDPPMILPHDGYLLPLKLDQGSINYKTEGGPQDRVEFLMSGANVNINLELENQRRDAIKKNYFVDLFLLLDQRDGKMTATEVVQRNAEKMLILAPTLGRLMSELLNPCIQRVFAIGMRNHWIPEAPPALQGSEYTIEYTSPLARAQKAEDLKSNVSFAQIVGEVAKFNPEAVDKINVDKYIDSIADIQGVSPEIVRNDDEVAQIRQARAKAQQEQMKMEMLAQGASAAKDGAKAAKDLRPEGAQ